MYYCITDEAPPAEESPPKPPEDEPVDDLQRRMKQSSQITLAIFNKRNQYSTLERKVNRPIWPGLENKLKASTPPSRGVTFEESSKSGR